MSLDNQKSETNLGFELFKWFGIIVSVLTTALLILFLNPGISGGLLGSMLSVTPSGSSITEAIRKMDQDFAKLKTGDHLSNSSITVPLAYGEGLTASEDIEANTVLETKHIDSRAKFPTAKLGQCSPLPYSSLIGKRSGAKIFRGEFFTTENVRF